jgi:hypothetical protein
METRWSWQGIRQGVQYEEPGSTTASDELTSTQNRGRSIERILIIQYSREKVNTTKLQGSA